MPLFSNPPAPLQGPIVGLAVAVGVGLLIGVERERKKGQGDDRDAAGLRSFIVAAACGALAQGLPVPGLVVVGAVWIGLLAVLAYGKSRSRDPGLTTELALFTTYLIGVQSVISPALGAACGAGLAALLAARDQLHRMAKTLLTEPELHDGLLLAALALIVLPLVPTEPLSWLAGMRPRPLVALVLLIMALQAAGQMAWRWLGPQRGVLVSGFASGFVSSTATVASMGSQARAQPRRAGVWAGGALCSAAATWVQALVMTAALSPTAAWALLPAAAAGATAALAGGAWMASAAGSAGSADTADSHPTAPAHSALRPREALLVAALLAGVALLVGQAQQRFGQTGLAISVALAALVDAHSPIASLASLHASNALSLQATTAGALLAISSNTLTRCAVAVVSGGWAYGWRVVASLCASLACAWMVAGWTVWR
jgi:uncharacterized membrane protein (DUF4010 family)